MGKKLTDLTERTATANTDLLHVNSDGTDYKESRSNFLKGDLYTTLSNSQTITASAESLPAPGTYFGYISSYLHQSATGMPENANFYVKIERIASTGYIFIDVWNIDGAEDSHYTKTKRNGTWDSAWTKIPSRSEISALNNSLTNSLLIGTPVTAQVSLSASGMQSADISDLSSPPSISGYVHQYWVLVSSTYRFTPVGYGGTRVYYWVGTTSTSSGSMVCYPIYKKNA